MKCQNLCTGGNKKNIINLSSADLAQSRVKFKIKKEFYPFNLSSRKHAYIILTPLNPTYI